MIALCTCGRYPRLHKPAGDPRWVMMCCYQAHGLNVEHTIEHWNIMTLVARRTADARAQREAP